MNSPSAHIGGVIVRELTSMKQELEAYPSEADIWKTAPGIANSAGTLAAHLAGNIQHFFGAVLNGSGYRRNRDLEFSARNIPRADLLKQLDLAIDAVQKTVRNLGDAELKAEYPEPIAKWRVNTHDWLVHLVSHLGYHLGQMDYHRRILTGNPATVGTVPAGKLVTAKEIQ